MAYIEFRNEPIMRNRKGWLSLCLIFILVLTFGANGQPIQVRHLRRLNHRNIQSESSPAANTDNISFVGSLGHDVAGFVNDSYFYALIGGLTITPLALKSQFAREDPELNEIWKSAPAADNLFEWGNTLGNAALPVSAGLLSYVIGGYGHDSELKSFGADLMRAHLFNGIVTLSMKNIVHRARPDNTPFSYPSGHTSTAFTTAGVIYKHFGLKGGLPAYAVAFYVGLSRLQENRHYLTDIVAGAIAGTYVSFKISNHNASNPESFQLQPASVSGSPGIRLSLSF